MNPCIFVVSILFLVCALYGAIRLGKEAMLVYMVLLSLCMNLFVLKEILLFGWVSTASEPLAVGYLISLNYFQELWGKKSTLHLIYLCIMANGVFIILSLLHLTYLSFGGPDYAPILCAMPRLLFASMATFLCVQLFDRSLFEWLKNKTHGRFFLGRVVAVSMITECLDTTLFSVLGLWGVISNLHQLILISICVKLSALALFSLFLKNKTPLTNRYAPLLSF